MFLYVDVEAMSVGDAEFLSSMRSANSASPSLPTGIAKDIVCCATFVVLCTCSTPTSRRRAISSAEGSRPSSCASSRRVRACLLIVPTTPGIRGFSLPIAAYLEDPRP